MKAVTVLAGMCVVGVASAGPVAAASCFVACTAAVAVCAATTGALPGGALMCKAVHDGCMTACVASAVAPVP